jgi:hypothetical protein
VLQICHDKLPRPLDPISSKNYFRIRMKYMPTSEIWQQKKSHNKNLPTDCMMMKLTVRA